MKKFLNILLPVVSFLVPAAMLFIFSCNEKVETVPVIDSITIAPDTVAAGGIALIVVSATDQDGDELVFSFSPQAGKISGYGDSVYWLAPTKGGLYKTIVRVTDPSGNQTSDSIRLFVLNSGKSEIVGTASFPEDIVFDLSLAKVRIYTSIAARAAGQAVDSTNVFGFGPIVSYRLPLVTPGTYYLDVWKDMDNSLTQSSGDFLGWYGSGDFAAPVLKPVVVQDSISSQVQVQMNVMP